MRSKQFVFMFAAMTAVGCTKTQRLTVARFDPSSMQTRFAEEAPAMATYVVEVDRPGKYDDTRVESTRVRVKAGTTLGFSRTESAVVAIAGGTTLPLPPLEGDAKLSWKGKTKRETKFARVVGTIGAGAVDVAIGMTEAYIDSKLRDDSDDEGMRPRTPKARKHHHHH